MKMSEEGEEESKTVPLVVYDHDVRRIIGQATVIGDEVRMEISDPDVIEKLNEPFGPYHSIGEISQSPKDPSLDFSVFVRRPYAVEAVEVTEENFDMIAEMTGTKKVKQDGTVYIETDRHLVPNVFRIYPGFLLTRMDGNLRAYSARTFEGMFCENTPELREIMANLEAKTT
jgi:hypothetical protein